MKKIKVWWRAVFGNYPYWRTYYNNGDVTRLLYYYEAKNMADVFGGKVRIDYKGSIERFSL